jgi:cytosol alanyl aminopeptidase
MRPIAVLAALVFSFPLAAAPLRLGTDVVPRAQSISLTIDPARDDYSGIVVVDLDVRRPVTTFRFHSEEIALGQIDLRGPAGSVPVTHAAGEESTVVVSMATPLQIGKHTLTISFTNEFDRRSVGLYKTTRGPSPYVFTQFQAIDARKAFPVWDEPAYKLPYQLAVKIPEQLSAVFNTPVASEAVRDGWKTVGFAPTKPVPAYMLAIAVGDFEFTPIPGLSIPARVVTVRGQTRLTGAAVEVTPPLLRALEEWFGIPYPYEKLDLIAVPEFWPGAMENPGAITFADRVLLSDPASTTPSDRRSLASITAHELAHMWFGDLVTMEWWDDFWLNESFADWMGDKIVEQVYPEMGHQLAELQNIQRVMTADGRASAEPIRKLDRTPQDAIASVGLAYNKGKGVLSMVEQWLGPEAFRAGVNRYLRAHAWGNAEAADLWAALAAEGRKKAPAVLGTFLDQPGFPLITFERLSGRRFRVSQERYASAGVTVPPMKWLVPISIRYADGGGSGVHTFLLEDKSAIIALPRDAAWIYPNANARGYYRWELPPADMQKLSERAPSILTPRERLGLVANVAALFAAGSIRGDRYLDLLADLGADPDPQVLSAVSGAVARLDQPFGGGESDAAWSAWLRRVFGPALDRVGFEPRPGEDPAITTLRPFLLARLGEAGDTRVLDFARSAAARVLTDPASVHPSIMSTVLRMNASSGDVALFEEYRRRFESSTVPAERSRFFAALSGFRNAAVRKRALDYALSGPLRPTEILNLANGYMEEESRDDVLAWVMANHDEIRKRIPPVALGSLASFGGGCDQEHFRKTREFFSAPERSAPVITRELEEVEEAVKECVALRQRESAAVARYLAGH